MHVLKNETEHGEQSRTNKNTNTDARSGARETRHHHATKNGGAEEHEHGEDTKETRGGVDTEHGRSIKRAETLKSGRRAVLNATAEIVGTWYKCDLRFCAEIFQSIKCDFQKCAEILKNIFKKSHLI